MLGLEPAITFAEHYFLSFIIIDKQICVMALTFLAVLPPESSIAQTSISLVCKTGLTNPVVVAPSSVLSTSVLKRGNRGERNYFFLSFLTALEKEKKRCKKYGKRLINVCASINGVFRIFKQNERGDWKQFIMLS